MRPGVVASVLTATVLAAVGCRSTSSGSDAQSPASTPPSASESASSSPSTSPSATASPTTTGTGGRLAFVAKSQMYVVRVSAAGTPVGLPGLVGPADISSQPLWSPLGRYLVWQWNDRKSHSENQGVVELYDTTTDKLVALRNLTVGAVAAAGTGAQVVLQRNESAVANVFYDRLGHGRTSGQATFKQLVSVLAVGHREALVETGDISGNSGKPATLWLLPPSGPPVRMSTIPTVRFLSMDIPPALGWTASANDGVHAAFVTALGQDGSCANGQSVHLVDLDARTDLAVALPYKDGDLRTPSYSPDGVLGGVLDECGTEGPDYHNSFVELHGSHWTTVVAGATLGARGPDGLLAVQLGSFPKKDYGANPSQDHPLTIRTASGATTARLPTATAIAWTQAATPPKG